MNDWLLNQCASYLTAVDYLGYCPELQQSMLIECAFDSQLDII